jgi:hypothetical protein
MNEKGKVIAELTEKAFRINDVQDALDMMADLGHNNCNRVIIHEQNLHEDFFNLKTGFAGEILQKFSNYKIRLAIVGDFARYQSRSLQDFIRESNRGNAIFFVRNTDTAIERLSLK